MQLTLIDKTQHYITKCFTRILDLIDLVCEKFKDFWTFQKGNKQLIIFCTKWRKMVKKWERIWGWSRMMSDNSSTLNHLSLSPKAEKRSREAQFHWIYIATWKKWPSEFHWKEKFLRKHLEVERCYLFSTSWQND